MYEADQLQSLPGVQDGSKKGYTSRYLTAVQAATNTVSSWLQKDNLLDSGIPSPVAAAAQQLHDERPLRKTTEVAALQLSSHRACLRELAHYPALGHVSICMRAALKRIKALVSTAKECSEATSASSVSRREAM